MKSAVIAVGSELLSGSVINSNAAFISKELNNLGIDVEVHYSIKDDPPVMSEILRYAISLCDLVICTGGLLTAVIKKIKTLRISSLKNCRKKQKAIFVPLSMLIFHMMMKNVYPQV